MRCDLLPQVPISLTSLSWQTASLHCDSPSSCIFGGVFITTTGKGTEMPAMCALLSRRQSLWLHEQAISCWNHSGIFSSQWRTWGCCSGPTTQTCCGEGNFSYTAAAASNFSYSSSFIFLLLLLQKCQLTLSSMFFLPFFKIFTSNHLTGLAICFQSKTIPYKKNFIRFISSEIKTNRLWLSF